jgi:RNA polymerase sigma-70 factor, ECF subfamily
MDRLNVAAPEGVLFTVKQASLEAEDRATSETESFEAFFEAHHARLYGTLCLVTSDRAEAEDVMQEAFLKLWERWDRVRAHPDPRGYLYLTAFNLFRSRLRRIARAARRGVARPLSDDPLAEVDARESLAAGLRGLTPRQRAAIVLLDLLDFSSEEAGRALRVRPVTVRVLASQGRAALRDTIGRDDD